MSLYQHISKKLFKILSSKNLANILTENNQIIISTGSIGLQSTSFPIMNEAYIDSAVTAVISLNCIGDETRFSECISTMTDIERCSIQSVAEVVCQGSYV